MTRIARGTTPVITVVLDDCEASELDALYVTIVQLETIVLEKELSDGAMDGNVVIFPLSQEDTLKLSAATTATLQVRGRVGDHAFASQAAEIEVKKILKEGVI